MLWVIYGYSVAFTAGAIRSGDRFDKLFMLGEDPATAVAATFSKGQYLPDFVYCMFQLTFAAITVALIAGGFAERFKFSAMILFSILWFTFAYLPDRAHGLVLGRSRRLHDRESGGGSDGAMPASSSRRARSTSRAAPWCTSIPGSRRWSAR